MDPDLRSDVSLSIVGYSATYCHGRISLSPAAIEPMANLVRSVHKSGENPSSEARPTAKLSQKSASEDAVFWDMSEAINEGYHPLSF